MGQQKTGELFGLSDGGISGIHQSALDIQPLVAPATANEKNLVRLPLIPLACWRIEDLRFDFDSSFPLPELRAEMPLLARLIALHTEPGANNEPGRNPPLSLFGHADPVGTDAVNKPLSGRRAAAIYGLLTRRDEVWQDIFTNSQNFTLPAAGDNWGTRSIQLMLNALGATLTVDGQTGPDTQAATKDFQNKNGLSPDGNPGSGTRKKLFRAYMDAICLDDQGKPFLVDAAEGFLARHDSAIGKGDFQGCSAFNPVLVFSRSRNDVFEQDSDKSKRNAANAPNRRVMALLFRPGSRALPEKWPCPASREGVAACVKRLFSNGEDRRGKRLETEDRKFSETEDTFACRFYQRMVAHSPCEREPELVPLKLRLINTEHLPLQQSKYKLEVGAMRFQGVTDDNGRLMQMIPAAATEGKLKLETWTLALDIAPIGEANEARGARMRIQNLGLAALEDHDVTSSSVSSQATGIDGLLHRAILRFQSMRDLETDGTLNQQTIAELKKVYGS